MSTIYDNMGNGSEDKSALDEVFGRSANKYEEPVVIKNAGPEMPVQKVLETLPRICVNIVSRLTWQKCSQFGR